MSVWHDRRRVSLSGVHRAPTPEEWEQSPEVALLRGREAIERENLEGRLAEAVARLPTREAEVAALRWGEAPAPWPQVAEALGVTVAVARTIEARARRRVRALLDEGEET